MAPTSPPIYIALVYGGIAILIFCVFLLLTPYAVWLHQRKQDIEFQESLKAKCRERTIIEMPSSSIQIIKSIAMGSNQSLSIKKLSASKKKKLSSFVISCICGHDLQRGTPYQIYDDTHYDPTTKCYQCYICDRSFHFESDSYLLFTCPQSNFFHENGFVICTYCVWICYLYQKNVKYYKHFVSIAIEEQNTAEAALLRPQTTYNGNYLFDDDDDYDDDADDSMDSYHQRTQPTIAREEEEEEEEEETEKQHKNQNANRYQIKNANHAIAEIKRRTFGLKQWFTLIWGVKHIYVAVLLYLIDTTTDISVAVIWGIRAYKEYVLKIETLATDNVNIARLFICCVFLLLFYRIVSCVVIYRQNKTKSTIHRWWLSVLQLCDVLIYLELYCSHLIGTKTENFLLISKMKALFESGPQSILQTFIVVRSTLVYNDIDDDIDVFIIYLSLISGIMSILHRFTLEDSYVFEPKANKKWPPSIGYLVRTMFRIFEILSRLLVFSLFATVIGERLAFIYAGIDFYVNLRFYRKGLIGPSFMNVLGYMLFVVDLASVPAPHHAKRATTKNKMVSTYSYSIPGLVKVDKAKRKQRMSLYKTISAIVRVSGAFCTMMMGFWIPYVIGCCNKYLDHFGFVVLTSRLYQHIALLFVMYLMLRSPSIITCSEPLCTSDALRSDIQEMSLVLIVIAFVCTVLSFVCYLFVSKYLKVGVIATERNPWLAVRVGDIYDALLIFQENYNIKSHEWKRNVFWPKFISSKYSIPNMKHFDDKNLRSLYRLLKTEDESNWDIPLIKAIAFDAVKIKFDDIFELFFHPKILMQNEGVSPLLNPYTCIDNRGNYIVHEAAKAGSAKILYILITRGNATIPVLNKLNETPLHLASRLGDIMVIELLLNAWSLTQMDKNGRYPIHYGVETANKQIVALMMGRINHLFESQYNESTTWSQMIGSLLLSCAQNSNHNMFEYILSIKAKGIVPNMNYKLASSGLAAIHYAVVTRNIRILSIILEQQNTDVNLIGDGDDGMTPLQMAVEHNDFEIVNYLLSNVAIDVNLQTLHCGYTALHFAFLNGKYNIDIIRALCQHPNLHVLPDFQNKQTPLHLALLVGPAPIAYLEEILTALHCKPSKSALNQQSLPHHNTLLHIAAMQNNSDLMQQLLELGADPVIQNADHHTCHDIAHHMQSNEQMRTILMKRLESIQLTNNDYYDNTNTNNDIAHRQQQRDALLQSIPRAASNVSQVSSDKYFWRAVENNDWQITRILLQQHRIKVDAFVRNGRFVGQTALHIACTLGHYETLIILMDEGDANVNIQSKIDLATPLLLSTRFNHIKCVAYLLNARQINVNIAALDETTPFYEAVYANHVEIIKLLLQNPHLNIKQKRYRKQKTDIINAYIIGNKETILKYNEESHTIANEYDEHPFESQLCKYCNFAFEEEDDMTIFYDCILDNLNNPTFLFLHVLCKEGHFKLLKYLIFHNININWIVKDGRCMYPIQYLVEWFQYDNKQTEDSQWILSYILQRTFGSLMFNKMEHVIWTNCTSTTCTACTTCNIDWNVSIKLPSKNEPQNETEHNAIYELLKTQNTKELKSDQCSFLNHVIISMFGLARCHWILQQEHNAQTTQNKHIFNALTCTDILNVNAYYEGVRGNERTYCFPYQFNHIQDITIYLDAMQTLETMESLMFPIDSFNSLCSLILSDDIPLDQLQYLLDILRNLLSYPSIHPLIVDLIFLEKMLNKICIEMVEYLMRDGSSLKNEISVFAIEATAIAAVTNCYKYPTAISQTILDIVYPLLSHSESPNIRLMTAKLLHNISLQIRITQLTSNDEDELKMEYEPSVPSVSSNKTRTQQMCDEIVQSLNYETDVRVRCICLQTLKLLMICNSNLIEYAMERNKQDEFIAHGIWNERDSLCCVNGSLHLEMMQCLQLQPNHIEPMLHLDARDKQFSKAIIDSENDEDYLYDEFKFDDEQRQKAINQDEGDEKYDEDDEDQPLLPIMGDMTTTNAHDDNEQLRKTELKTNTRDGAELKKIYSEGANMLCNEVDEANEWRETVLINSTPNKLMAFSTHISEKTLAQMGQTQCEDADTHAINVTLLKQPSNEPQSRPVGFAVMGHAQDNEQIAFVLNSNNNCQNQLDDDRTTMHD